MIINIKKDIPIDTSKRNLVTFDEFYEINERDKIREYYERMERIFGYNKIIKNKDINKINRILLVP